MDFEQVRTFIEVIETGSFVRAADMLNVTQSTVSARIKELEYRLGQALFIRRKSGVVLTTAGRRFQPHAATLMHVLQRARHDFALSPETRAVISVGGQYSLWERILQTWMGAVRLKLPDVAVRAEVGGADSLMRHLSEGLLDFAVLYSPEARPGFDLEVLLEEELILVATVSRHSGPASKDYIFVDWGPDFEIWHGAMFPAFSAPELRVSLGSLGLTHILQFGGAGYFTKTSVQPYLKAKKLFRIRSAPTFVRPVHIIYPTDMDAPGASEAIDLLRSLAAA
jgi:LysR family transcriptional regulator, flagellar master operon regulator